jgi:hypothetical protein
VTILHSLAEIGRTIVLDRVVFREEAGDDESTFSLREDGRRTGLSDRDGPETIRRHLLPICSGCSRIRNDAGEWIGLKQHIGESFHADFSHGCVVGVDHVAVGTDFTEGRPRAFFDWLLAGKARRGAAWSGSIPY